MITRCFLASLLIVGLSAQAKTSDCDLLLQNSPLDDVLSTFRTLGLNDLLHGFEQVQVSRRARLWPWQPAVSARINWRGKKLLVLRPVQISTEVEREKYTWDVARALFQLQVSTRYFHDVYLKDSVEKDELTVGFKAPSQWRDEKLKTAQASLLDLYRLFMSLNALDVEAVLPAKDLGRFWRLKAYLHQDTSNSIVPNREDFELLKNEGREKFGAAFTKRHERGLLFSYYFNHLRKMLAITFIALTTIAPAVHEIPTFIESSESFQEYVIDKQIDVFEGSQHMSQTLKSDLQAAFDHLHLNVYANPK